MIITNANFDTELAKVSNQPVSFFEIAGYGKVFATHATGFTNHQPWITTISNHKQSVNDLKGTSQLGSLRFSVLDDGDLITADFPGFVFEGKDVVLKTGFLGMAEGDYIQVFSGIIDEVMNDQHNNVYTFSCKDRSRFTKKTIYDTGDGGDPISEDDPKTIEGNPLDILEDILLTQVGLAAGEVDSVRLQAYRDGIFAGYNFKFILTAAPEAKKFIEKEILTPLGGYMWTNAEGKVTVNFFTPLDTDSLDIFQLDEDNVKGIPAPMQSPLVNVVIHKFDKGDDDFKSQNVEVFATSETKYGMQGRHTIESKGMRANFQGFSVAARAAASIFNRYGDKNLKVKLETLWDTMPLELGDRLTLTHSMIPDREAGTIGITSKKFEILGWTKDYLRGKVSFDLIDAGDIQPGESSSGGVYDYAPNATPEWTSASAAEKDAYQFVTDDATGQYSDATPGHPIS